MSDHEKPRPEDTPHEAERKSLSVDERIPETGPVPPRTADTIIAGGPGTYSPEAGMIHGGLTDVEENEAELALERERRGARADVRPG